MTLQERPVRLQMVDILRCVALAGMVVYHFSVDLAIFGFIDPGLPFEGGLRLLARVVASSFLFLAGFSLFLAHGRGIRWQAFRYRLLIIVCAALLVTAVTYAYDGTRDTFVYFGILHEIALTSLAGLVFLRTPVILNIVVAAGVLALPRFVQFVDLPWWLWWLGLAQGVRQSLDYVPFFPWFSAGLAGLTVARILSATKSLRFLRYGLPIRPLDRFMQWCGRHSLMIYLIHQPVLIAGFVLFLLLFQPS